MDRQRQSQADREREIIDIENTHTDTYTWGFFFLPFFGSFLLCCSNLFIFKRKEAGKFRHSHCLQAVFPQLCAFELTASER